MSRRVTRVQTAVALAALCGAGLLAFRPLPRADATRPVRVVSRATARVQTTLRPRTAPTTTSPRLSCARRSPVVHGSPGGTLALDRTSGTVVLAEVDSDQVVVVSTRAGQAQIVRRIPVGRGPVQTALTDDGRVYVIERYENTVSAYDVYTGSRLCSTAVSADPVGLSLAPDGRRLYVSSGISRRLTELDADTLAVRSSIETPREPRGVAVSPDGTRVLLAHLSGSPLSAWDVSTNGLSQARMPSIPIPQEQRIFRHFFHRHIRPLEPPLMLEKNRPTEPAPRDGAATRNARMIFSGRFPGRTHTVNVELRPSQAWSVAIDGERSVAYVGFMLNRTGKELPVEQRLDVYGGGSSSPSVPNEKSSFAMGVFDLHSWRWRRVSMPELGGRAESTQAMRIPTGISVRPDGSYAVVGMGSDVVASFAMGTTNERSSRRTLQAPCGVVTTNDGTELVFSQLTHQLEVRRASNPAQVVSVATPTLSAEIERGRLLFHRANDRRISSGGLSCAGCHPDTRDDGLVWFLAPGPRQTPTLAGRVEHPFNWNGTARTLSENLRQTVRRLGGRGLPEADVQAVVSFLEHGIRPPTVQARTLSPQEERGRLLFSGNAGCADCHDPARNFTDGRTHELGGLRSDERRRAFDTPSLRFLTSTAPYFHDGRYETLAAMLRDGRHHMGTADTLEEHERADLEAYLRTL